MPMWIKLGSTLALLIAVTAGITFESIAAEARQIVDPYQPYDESPMTHDERMFWRRVMSVVHPEGNIFPELYRTGQNNQLTFERYIVRSGDTLSGLLFKRGVGQPNSIDRIYGPGGWSRRLIQINRRVGTMRKSTTLVPGMPILLIYPRLVDIEPEQESAAEVPFEDPTYIPDTEPEPDVAEETPIDFEPETEEATNKYAELFNLQLDAYLGFRYGHSIVESSTPLISKSYFYGLLFELRSGALSGIRLYWDRAPKVHDTDRGIDVNFAFDRMTLGYAFDFDLWESGHKFHLIPKVGRYNLQTHLVVHTDAQGHHQSRDFDIDNAVSTGLEADLEYNKSAFTVRGWAAADLPSSTFGYEQDTSLRSVRAGIDATIRGPTAQVGSLNLSSTLLLFAANERITLEDKSNADTFEAINLDISYVGIGSSLIW